MCRPVRSKVPVLDEWLKSREIGDGLSPVTELQMAGNGNPVVDLERFTILVEFADDPAHVPVSGYFGVFAGPF